MRTWPLTSGLRRKRSQILNRFLTHASQRRRLSRGALMARSQGGGAGRASPQSPLHGSNSAGRRGQLGPRSVAIEQFVHVLLKFFFRELGLRGFEAGRGLRRRPPASERLVHSPLEFFRRERFLQRGRRGHGHGSSAVFKVRYHNTSLTPGKPYLVFLHSDVAEILGASGSPNPPPGRGWDAVRGHFYCISRVEEKRKREGYNRDVRGPARRPIGEISEVKKI
jgi:hypothetical protein